MHPLSDDLHADTRGSVPTAGPARPQDEASPEQTPPDSALHAGADEALTVARPEVAAAADMTQWDVPPGWQVPWPDAPAPGVTSAGTDRLVSILTSAVTSAGVTLLVLWLWGPGGAPRADSGNFTVTYQPLEAGAAPRAAQPDPEGTSGESSAADTLAIETSAVGTAGHQDGPGTPVATPVRRAAAGRPAGLLVVSQPEGASVTINGVGYGTTPTRIRYLPPGPKRIRVTKDGFGSEERYYGPETPVSAATLRIVMREAPRTRRLDGDAREVDSSSRR